MTDDKIRPPAVAGQFYPADPVTLARLVDRMLDAVEVPSGEGLAPAYVVPHAGYRFSGPTAAEVYARLRRHADEIQRVVLVGPAHRIPLKGCAVPAVSTWRTPLGDLAIDQGTRALVAAGRAVADDAPHAPEHSLEVQLPFLQRVVGDPVPVLPIVTGPSNPEDVADTIAAAVSVSPAGTVVLCSTDLSHFLPQAQAQVVDGRTAQAVLALAADRIGVRDACGFFALRGLIGWARSTGLTPHLLRLSTSADTTGDPTRVVGYPAFALHTRPHQSEDGLTEQL